MLLLAAALAAQVAADPASGRRLPPVSFFGAGPVEAADHEAEFMFHLDSGPVRDIRINLVRSGRWLRETYVDERGRTVAWADFGAATSVTSVRDEAGGQQALQISRAPGTSSYNLIRRERTGQRDRALGEACEVWRIARVGEEDRRYDRLSCETADGIQLWAGRSDFTSGAVVRELRIVSLRRRRVAPVEVRPSASLLRWADWRDLPPLSPAPARRPRGYELRLAAMPHSGGDRARIMRRRGNWTYSDTTMGDGRRLLGLDNRAALLSYQAGPDGRPIELRLIRLPPEQVRAEDGAGYRRLVPPSSELVLGQTCFWSAPTGGVLVLDSQRDCVTGDGLPLRSVSGHRTITRLVATSLTRRPPPVAALMPPPEAFDWDRWGIQPID